MYTNTYSYKHYVPIFSDGLFEAIHRYPISEPQYAFLRNKDISHTIALGIICSCKLLSTISETNDVLCVG